MQLSFSISLLRRSSYSTKEYGRETKRSVEASGGRRVVEGNQKGHMDLIDMPAILTSSMANLNSKISPMLTWDVIKVP